MIHLALFLLSTAVVITFYAMMLGALILTLTGAQRAVRAVAREVTAPLRASLPPPTGRTTVSEARGRALLDMYPGL